MTEAPATETFEGITALCTACSATYGWHRPDCPNGCTPELHIPCCHH